MQTGASAQSGSTVGIPKVGDRIDRENCVTLYNADKLDSLTHINLKGDNSQKSEVVPSPEYKQNLDESFRYTPIEANAPNNVIEDSQILFAQM